MSYLLEDEEETSELQGEGVYYILTTYVCQFQNGKVHFYSSTGVQMSSQNIHSIFGPNLFEELGVYRLMRHFL